MPSQTEIRPFNEYEPAQVSTQELLFRKRIGGNLRVVDVTSYEWALIRMEIRRGSITFRIGKTEATVRDGAYGLFLPPFSVYRSEIRSPQIDLHAYMSIAPVPEHFPRVPLLFPWESGPLEAACDRVADILSNARGTRFEAANSDADVLAVRIKDAIDRSFESTCAMSEIAGELDIAPATLSRYFKRKYGLTAVAYRGMLRSVWAVQKLTRGHRNISDIAFDCGYNDLGRFNKQFRRHLMMTPTAIARNFGPGIT